MRPTDDKLKKALVEYEHNEKQRSVEFEAMTDLLHLRTAVRLERKYWRECLYEKRMQASEEVFRLVHDEQKE